MKRVILIVLDSFGIGSTKDSYKFKDNGSDTFGHIAEYCFRGLANSKLREGLLKIPNLVQLGISKAAEKSRKKPVIGLEINNSLDLIGSYGYAEEISSGKDTSSGHWEIAGVPVLFNWDYFLEYKNSFPENLLKKIVDKCFLHGYLGNCRSSGTDILSVLGEKHIKTKYPIFYTSADSVFQIACHEKIFGLNNLNKLGQDIRKILDEEKYNIARVITRPFLGQSKSEFYRTGNRHDFSVKPTSVTIMEKVIKEKKGNVISIGKISDIYANVGISKKIKATGIDELFNCTLTEIQECNQDNSMIFVNFVDFDSSWGHRRDVSGYAAGLELFDSRLPEILKSLKKDDLLIITSDHGCDPTWFGTDHTRENIPILIYSLSIEPKYLGFRKTFSDIAQTIASYFGTTRMNYGKNML
ncbi:phosphopentomutase [Buchnera aphidicola]|uniref:Phosphopentomutase n=1 Tax=Buchnera aphidicola (Anoecia oenotherae) TaxID=1241833 RepID=A0A4D6XYJ2_9GAMM|nr:phosphopentomutase [Buchnera aphidicola]QCI19538.1 phosphopentomutase [Buchnera aphidicola (Anoecia oenotherae)]